MSSTFHIIYPRGDLSKLSVVEITEAQRYELDDYVVASRHSFETWEAARTYAKQLAEDRDRQYVSNPVRDKEDFYLD